jgi:hypothetical protein
MTQDEDIEQMSAIRDGVEGAWKWFPGDEWSRIRSTIESRDAEIASPGLSP